MKYSWQRGCPVPIKNLRLIRMSYLGFDREVHWGEMVVHRSVAEDVVKVFHAMFTAKYRIRRMRLVDDYGGDDDRSMAADNTSAFKPECYRRVRVVAARVRLGHRHQLGGEPLRLLRRGDPPTRRAEVCRSVEKGQRCHPSR